MCHKSLSLAPRLSKNAMTARIESLPNRRRSWPRVCLPGLQVDEAFHQALALLEKLPIALASSS